MSPFFAAAASLSIALACAPALAQTPATIPAPTTTLAAPALGDDEVIKVETRLLEIPINARLKTADRAVEGLRAGDFTIEVDGTRREMGLFDVDRRSFNLVLIIDQSASMGDAARTAMTAATQLLSRLQADDRVRALVLADGLTYAMGTRSSTAAEVLTGLQSFALRDAQGGTSFYDAVLAAHQQTSEMRAASLAQGRSARSAIIAFTDGVDTASARDLAQTRELFYESSDLFYAMKAQGRTDAGDPLCELAGLTGGLCRELNVLSVARELDAIVSELRTFYLLSVYLEPSDEDGRSHAIRVSLTGTRARDAATLAYRRFFLEREREASQLPRALTDAIRDSDVLTTRSRIFVNQNRPLSVAQIGEDQISLIKVNVYYAGGQAYEGDLKEEGIVGSPDHCYLSEQPPYRYGRSAIAPGHRLRLQEGSAFTRFEFREGPVRFLYSTFFQIEELGTTYGLTCVSITAPILTRSALLKVLGSGWSFEPSSAARTFEILGVESAPSPSAPGAVDRVAPRLSGRP